MRNQRLVTLALAPVILFLLVLALVAAFVTHPPVLGWVGLCILACGLLAAATAILVLLARMRTNAPRLHPGESDLHRLLVVTDADVEPAELSQAVRLRTLGRQTEVRVVAPVIADSVLHFLSEDEDAERDAARHRLSETLSSLAGVGIHAEGAVGTDDPLQAIGDAAADFRADEILLVALLPSARGWLDREAEEKIRDTFGVPVSTVFGRQPVSAGAAVGTAAA